MKRITVSTLLFVFILSFLSIGAGSCGAAWPLYWKKDGENLTPRDPNITGLEVGGGQVPIPVNGILVKDYQVLDLFLSYYTGFDFISQTNYDLDYDTSAIIVGAGTNTVADSFATLVTGANPGDQEGTRSLTAIVDRANSPVCEFVVEIPSVASGEYFVGFNTQSDGGHAANDEFALIGFDKSVSDNWILIVDDGATGATTDSGVAVTTAKTKLTLAVSGGGSVNWKIGEDFYASSPITYSSNASYIMFLTTAEAGGAVTFKVNSFGLEYEK